MTPELHSPVGPSGAAQRIQCPASVQMQQRYPEVEPSPKAAEGTAAHWAAQCMLLGTGAPAVGAQAPNGVLIDEGMLDAAEMYVDDIRRNVAVETGACEVPVTIRRIHEQAWGTPDFRTWVAPFTLHLWDFKYGHRPVEAFENQQLIEYAAGCHEGVARAIADTQVTVVATIVQPRAHHPEGPIRRWTFNLGDVRAQINVGSNAAHEALGANPHAATGPACWDCTARHACGTFQREFQSALGEAGRMTPLDLRPAEAAVELHVARRALKTLEARTEALEQQVLRDIRAGRPVPGWSVSHESGRTTWSRPAAEVLNLGALMQIDLGKPAACVTPRQALDLGVPAEVVKQFSTTKPGAAKLTLDSGVRARSVFG